MPAVAAKVSDDEVRAALLQTAQVIDRHIAAGTRKVERELAALVVDPVNGRFERDDLGMD